MPLIPSEQGGATFPCRRQNHLVRRITIKLARQCTSVHRYRSRNWKDAHRRRGGCLREHFAQKPLQFQALFHNQQVDLITEVAEIASAPRERASAISARAAAVNSDSRPSSSQIHA